MSGVGVKMFKLRDRVMPTNKPLIYSCSGCSNLARMANDIALNIDSEGVAEMSCIAGISGNVQSMVNLAKSGRKIIAIDGCQLACIKSCLSASQISIDHYYDISAFGIEKKDKWSSKLCEDSLAMTTIYDDLIVQGLMKAG